MDSIAHRNETPSKVNIQTSSKEHSRLEKAAMFVFVVSLGLGEVITVFSIKLSYIATIFYAFVALYGTRGRIQLTVENKRYNLLLKFCYIWLAYAVLQLLWVRDYDLYFTFFRILVINIIIIFFIITYVRSYDDWMFVLRSFLVLIAISLAVGFWEIQSGNHVVELVGDGNLTYYSHRPIAFYGNGNDYATVLGLGLFGVSLYIERCKKLVNYCFITVLVIEMIRQIIVIDCRGALYSLYFCAGLVPLLLFANLLSKDSKVKTKLVNLGLIIIAIGMIIFIFSRYSATELITKYSGSGNLRSDLGRLQMIKNGLKALWSSVGLGVGAGQSILANNINLHFFYLEILVEYGVFVGGYLIVMYFKLAFRNSSRLTNYSNAIIRTFPIVLILLGVSSSGMLKLRPTWIVFTLFYTLTYNEFGKELNI